MAFYLSFGRRGEGAEGSTLEKGRGNAKQSLPSSPSRCGVESPAYQGLFSHILTMPAMAFGESCSADKMRGWGRTLYEMSPNETRGSVYLPLEQTGPIYMYVVRKRGIGGSPSFIRC